MKFRPMPIAASLVLLSAALFAAAPPLHAQTPAEKADKLVSLMKADNLSYGATTSPTVFTIHFTGTNLKDIKVVLAVGGDEDSDLVVKEGGHRRLVARRRKCCTSMVNATWLERAQRNLDRRLSALEPSPIRHHP